LKQKVAPKVIIILGYFNLSKNHNDPLKVAQLAKIAQSGHPETQLGSTVVVHTDRHSNIYVFASLANIALLDHL
jgi:hypothetical protein